MKLKVDDYPKEFRVLTNFWPWKKLENFTLQLIGGWKFSRKRNVRTPERIDYWVYRKSIIKSEKAKKGEGGLVMVYSTREKIKKGVGKFSIWVMNRQEGSEKNWIIRKENLKTEKSWSWLVCFVDEPTSFHFKHVEGYRFCSLSLENIPLFSSYHSSWARPLKSGPITFVTNHFSIYIFKKNCDRYYLYD